MTEPEASPATAMADASLARNRYQTLEQQITTEIGSLEKTDARFGVARVWLFFAAIVCWFLGFYADNAFVFQLVAGVLTVGFLGVVILNEPYRDRLEAARRTHLVVRRLIARVDRDWNTLAKDDLSRRLEQLELTAAQRDVAGDLDLFGSASLLQLVSMTGTTPGARTLARWLAEPAVAERAAMRAAAVEALAPRFDERVRFYTLARDVGRSSGDPDHFVEWATGPTWLSSRRWLVVWANASAVVTVGLLLVLAASVMDLVPVAARIALLTLFVIGFLNLLVAGVVLGPAHQIFSVAMSSRRAVDEYRELFAAARWLPEATDRGRARLIGELRDALLAGDTGAIQGMEALSKVARAGGLRQSAGTFLLYLPLQAFTLWDVRVLRRLEQWQSRYGKQTAVWFDALGQLEAMLSLAALRDEYPDWATPQWDSPETQEPKLEAEEIGHPLLRDAERVCNDVTIGPPGTFLLVTGSNMSGKSTMLRSVGLNVALAAAGGPVCAKRFVLPSLSMATSIRVSDDLSQGVSFYMAELHRLKRVVDQAKQLADTNDQLMLFLLDEILQGTNSRERQIAVVQVLRSLVAYRAIGAITTHDLELADEPELKALATTVHFRETIEADESGNETMTFDYRMRDGVSPTTNALRLLEMVGLGSSADRLDSQDV